MPNDDPTPLDLLLISGSLRENSYNTGLLRAFAEEVPPHVSVSSIVRLGDLPHLSDDFFQESGFPEPVVRLREQVEAADAVIIACPEYAYGIPGNLKNALDWLSYPPPVNPLRFKPVAIMGASVGPAGTIRAQSHLRQSLLFFEASLLTKPEIQVGLAATKFSEQGDLTDPAARELIVELIAELERFIPSDRAFHGGGNRPYRFN